MGSTHLKVAGGLVVAMVLVALGAVAGSALGSAPGDRAASLTPSEIAIHGDWLVRVLDTDGSLVSEHQFQNALTSSGAEHLAGLLARERTQGRWSIALYDTGGVPSAVLFEENASEAVIDQVETIDGGTGLRLSASFGSSFSMPSAIDIGEVRTQVLHCPASMAPDDVPEFGDCGGGSALFAAHALQDPVTVLQGQHLVIQVTYTFD